MNTICCSEVNEVLVDRHTNIKPLYMIFILDSRGIDYLHKLYLYLNTQHIKKQKLRYDYFIYRVASQQVWCYSL